jgi:anthraniloyl-CoA monooxygenase
MKIAILGGGPAGLYAALLLKRRGIAAQVTVWERDPADATYGFGVVLAEQVLDALRLVDEGSGKALAAEMHRWDDIVVHFKGAAIRCGGHRFGAISRQRLLSTLRACCEQAGGRIERANLDAASLDALRANADLVIAADGARSAVRERHAAQLGVQHQEAACRYLWMRAGRAFDAFHFFFKHTAHGWFQAHVYPYGEARSTVIVETPEAVWRAHGLDRMTAAQSAAWCADLFAAELEGAPLEASAGAAGWSRFLHVSCERWVVEDCSAPLVLAGDAAHTAHFSIGSGTRLALEDAIALADALAQGDGLMSALARYQEQRRVAALRLQNAARNSTDWFENVERYASHEAPQFAYALLTRSQRLDHGQLRERDPGYVEAFNGWFAERAAAQAEVDAHAATTPAGKPLPPLWTPFRARGLILNNRVVVSPMAQYSAVEGTVGDYHLVHLGARAMGGAGLVMAEMTAVSADARITPGCPGLYRPEHQGAWARVVDYVHQHSTAAIGMQLGHAGPKGSTRPMWEGIDMPLDRGNWPLLGPSELQYMEGVSQWTRAATAADLQRIRDDFVRSARMAAAAGFDWLELHCAHGYLLSAFISPLTNTRKDSYGGSLENRCRFPLEVLDAVRAAWPDERPISVRISAHDWVDGGTTPDIAVRIARLFAAAGADLIDCSSGQVSKREAPRYGRLFQVPFADRIRNEAGIATIAVGAIETAEQANTIIAAGRADLVAIGRPHLANPAWALHEAARLGVRVPDWPRQYDAGRRQLERIHQRARQQG